MKILWRSVPFFQRLTCFPRWFYDTSWSLASTLQCCAAELLHGVVVNNLTPSSVDNYFPCSFVERRPNLVPRSVFALSPQAVTSYFAQANPNALPYGFVPEIASVKHAAATGSVAAKPGVSQAEANSTAVPPAPAGASAQAEVAQGEGGGPGSGMVTGLSDSPTKKGPEAARVKEKLPATEVEDEQDLQAFVATAGSERLVLVDFGAKWCKNCKAILVSFGQASTRHDCSGCAGEQKQFIFCGTSGVLTHVVDGIVGRGSIWPIHSHTEFVFAYSIDSIVALWGSVRGTHLSGPAF